MLTSLVRRVRKNTVSPDGSDALRYRALKDYVLSNGIMRLMELPAGETTPFVVGKELYGETVEEAVDALEGICTVQLRRAGIAEGWNEPRRWLALTF
ncbi:MAG: hypothetical protein ACJ746_13690 [Bryobacteraceae bacterium]